MQPLTALILLLPLLPSISARPQSTPDPTTPNCPTISPFTISNFQWFDSAHNLDCISDSPDPDCETGKTPQPPGYGPPDTISVSLLDPNTGESTSCGRSDPGSVPAGPIPDGSYHFCGDAAILMAFGGNWIAFDSRNVACPNGRWEFIANVTLDMSCTTDDGGNKTCITTQPTIEVTPDQFVFDFAD